MGIISEWPESHKHHCLLLLGLGQLCLPGIREGVPMISYHFKYEQKQFLVCHEAPVELFDEGYPTVTILRIFSWSFIVQKLGFVSWDEASASKKFGARWSFSSTCCFVFFSISAIARVKSLLNGSNQRAPPRVTTSGVVAAMWPSKCWNLWYNSSGGVISASGHAAELGLH